MSDTYPRLSIGGRGGNFVQLITGKPRRKNAHHQTTQCRSCSGFFTSKEKGQLFCSRKCWRASVATDVSPYRDCQQCGSTFKPASNSLGIYCSSKCYGAKLTIDARLRYQAPIQLAKVCRVCDKEFGGGRSSKQCSEECGKAFARINAQQIAQALHRQDARTTNCVECSAMFCPLYGASHVLFCLPCAEGRQRSGKAARRTLRKAMESQAKVELVDPHKVFARDGWHCRICGVSTPLALRGTYEDAAPELDHIRPLSKGGEHSYRNTQCACRKCNGSKSNTWTSGGYGLLAIKRVAGIQSPQL